MKPTGHPKFAHAYFGMGNALRDREALAKLPAQEQEAFIQLWADVAVLLRKAQEKPE